MPRFAVFETALGLCALRFVPGQLVGTHLPEGSAEKLRARIHGVDPSAVEGALDEHAARVVSAWRSLFANEPTGGDFRDVSLDYSAVPEFHRRAYEALRAVGPGATTTYGALAQELGDAGAARAVGVAMGKNPFPVVVPCHRVLASGGTLGGFSAYGGVVTKERLLALEGVTSLPLF